MAKGIASGVVGLAVILLAVEASGAGAQQSVPPDTTSTLFVSDTIPGYGAVGGVAVDASGYVYVADFRNSVWRITPEGHVARFADGFYGASGNAVGPRGYLYQSSFFGNYVSRISRAGDVETWVDEGLAGPVGIAVDSVGTLFVCNCRANTIARVDSDRVATTFAKGPLLACPNGITFDDRGDLYVVSFSTTAIARVAPDGTMTTFTDIPGGPGNGHITFARGGFYVTKFGANEVFRVERDGSYRLISGSTEAGEVDGPGEVARHTRPNGIAAGPLGKVLWINDLVSGTTVGRGPSTVAMRRIRLITLSDVLAAVPRSRGVDAIEAAFEAYRAERPGENTTTDAGTLGFQWMSSGRAAEGVKLMELNAQAFPDDATAQYNLGEAYRYMGRKRDAARQYRRTLQLDPDRALARSRLELVGGGS